MSIHPIIKKISTNLSAILFVVISFAFLNENKNSAKHSAFINGNIYSHKNISCDLYKSWASHIFSPNEHLLTGNPSNASNDVRESSNYLMIKSSFALSYNNSKGCANWVSWHLANSWKGHSKRCNCFATDKALPDYFYKVTAKDYSKTGFDRGHLCPSEDRDLNEENNAETFLMSNMIPQSPNLNRISWVSLENYCRKLLDNDFELYILAGGYGKGGTGSKGFAEKIGLGKITVPSNCWKIIIVLPLGNNDLQRISTNTRIIAVDFPNNQTVKNLPWYQFRTSVDEIEEKTGLNFLNKVPDFIESKLESRVDQVNIN